MSELKAIIFDVDGTLSETEEVHRAAFNQAFQRHGLTWNWERSAYRELLKTTGGKERIRKFIEQSEPDRLKDKHLDEFIRSLHRTVTSAWRSKTPEMACCQRSARASRRLSHPVFTRMIKTFPKQH